MATGAIAASAIVTNAPRAAIGVTPVSAAIATRRDERPEYGEPLAPGTLELFPLTEASADADAEASAAAAASSGDGAHGPLTDDTDRGVAADADVTWRGRVGVRRRRSARGRRRARHGQAQAHRTRRTRGQEDGREAVVEVRQVRGGARCRKARCRKAGGRKVLLEAPSREEHARPQGREALGRVITLYDSCGS